MRSISLVSVPPVARSGLRTLVVVIITIRNRREAAIFRSFMKATAALFIRLDAQVLFARGRLLLVRRGVCRRFTRLRHSIGLGYD